MKNSSLEEIQKAGTRMKCKTRDKEPLVNKGGAYFFHLQNSQLEIRSSPSIKISLYNCGPWKVMSPLLCASQEGLRLNENPCLYLEETATCIFWGMPLLHCPWHHECFEQALIPSRQPLVLSPSCASCLRVTWLSVLGVLQYYAHHYNNYRDNPMCQRREMTPKGH